MVSKEGEILNLEDENEDNHVDVEEDEEVSVEPSIDEPNTDIAAKDNPDDDRNNDDEKKSTESIIPVTNDDDLQSQNTDKIPSPTVTSPRRPCAVASPCEKLPVQELSVNEEVPKDSIKTICPIVSENIPKLETSLEKDPKKTLENMDQINIIKEIVDLKKNLNITTTDKEINHSKCDCVKQRPLIDQITITDVTEGNITVTIKECFTDAGFFFPRR